MPKIPSYLIHHDHQFAFQFISFILIILVFGCTSHRFAGAPSPSYDVDKDLEQLAGQFDPSTAITNYYNNRPNQTPQDRNIVISARLVMTNLQYLKWLRTATADKQFLDTATDVLVLSLNIAATAIGVETAKTVLSAISAGVVGSKASVDKHYYFEKTLPAIVAAMNAQRKTILARILDGMRKSLEDYPFEQALADIYEYYQAGTFMGAIITIEAESGVKEKAADDEIKKIMKIGKPTPDEVDAHKKLYPVWVQLYQGYNAGQIPNVEKLRSALQSLGEDVPPSDREVLDKLHGLARDRKKTTSEILKALKDADYPEL